MGVLKETSSISAFSGGVFVAHHLLNSSGYFGGVGNIFIPGKLYLAGVVGGFLSEMK